MISPIVAGVLETDHTPTTGNNTVRDYQALRANRRVLFDNLGITTTAPTAA